MPNSPLMVSLDILKDEDDGSDDDAILFSPSTGRSGHSRVSEQTQDVPRFVSISSVASSTDKVPDNQKSSHVGNE
eukprot:8309975-Ditylum_brightwellii.AAC.2